MLKEITLKLLENNKQGSLGDYELPKVSRTRAGMNGQLSACSGLAGGMSLCWCQCCCK